LPRGKKRHHDDFKDWSLHLMLWIKAHWVSVVEVLVIGLIAFVVVVGTTAYGQHRADAGAVALYEAQKLPNGSEGEIAALSKVAKDYRRTFAGKDALMQLGELFFARGDYAAAIERYQALADGTRSQPMLHIAALHRLANAQLALGNPKDAAETYRKAAAEPGNLVAIMSNLMAATCLERAGEYAAAADLYRRIMSDAGDGDRAARDVSEGRLLWLQAKGYVGDAPRS
jgi:tetratricopeptide (TPR) repeat protein